MIRISVVLLAVITLTACSSSRLNTTKQLDYCTAQAAKTMVVLPVVDSMPRNIAPGQTQWRVTSYKDWTSGFWPGILWYVYEYTKDNTWRDRAAAFTGKLQPLAFRKASDHDLGFQMYCSYGNGLRLTGDTSYKRILLATADTLATLFNPKTGTILSWPGNVKRLGGHNTIIDNMINLELLFWASKNGGSQRLYDIAVQHANTTMKNHFRPDYSTYHVLIYDTVTGQVIKKHTHQGFADSSMWARGQAWAIYGFTMCYRETKNKEYLQTAMRAADRFISQLPKDKIPYWDFNAPDIPHAPRDASAAAVTASALLELSTLVDDASKALWYRNQATAILSALSTAAYQSRNTNNAFLLHSTGHKPNNSEIDYSIIYADYYYIEALLRLKKLQAPGK